MASYVESPKIEKTVRFIEVNIQDFEWDRFQVNLVTLIY